MKRVWLLLFGMSILFCFAACAAEEPSECNHKYIIKSEIESTCTERGVVIYGCQKCDECYQEELPVLGHTREVVAAVPATCVNSGLTEGSYCSTCGEILEAQIEVSTMENRNRLWTLFNEEDIIIS